MLIVYLVNGVGSTKDGLLIAVQWSVGGGVGTGVNERLIGLSGSSGGETGVLIESNDDNISTRGTVERVVTATVDSSTTSSCGSTTSSDNTL